MSGDADCVALQLGPELLTQRSNAAARRKVPAIELLRKAVRHEVTHTDARDAIHAIGLITIYFGYLESDIDEIIEHSRSLVPLDPDIDNRMFTRKLKELRKALRARLTLTTKTFCASAERLPRSATPWSIASSSATERAAQCT